MKDASLFTQHVVLYSTMYERRESLSLLNSVKLTVLNHIILNLLNYVILTLLNYV
jgi:hypothetical protein